MFRRKTRSVMVGKVGVGGENPIRIQSMTTTNTQDVEKTIDQIMCLADAGCEIARMTVQGKKEAFACEAIKEGLVRRGYEIPLVADIHFYPPAALIAAQFVDKVRINPGNFVRTRERIEEQLALLIELCKKEKRALRIGTNLGSLSDYILTQYGNTPRGMVESALEFARSCRDLDFHDIVFSMKASNPQTMVEAVRLLVLEMDRLGWDYPIHLGVTEAGFDDAGRIRSAMGIGALLFDGIGDTIRISLTEEPSNEIDPCRRLIAFYEERSKQGLKVDPVVPKQIPTRGKVFFKAPVPALAQQPDGILGTSDHIIFAPRSFPLHETRRFVRDLQDVRPIILHLNYGSLPPEEVIIRAAADAGAILIDRLVEGICVESTLSQERTMNMCLNMLQCARLRMDQTEYISCPGCGRTLFDIQTVARQVQEMTRNYKGLKIAVMGCVVNGPGEMADADFGLVGSKPGKVDLYHQQECVEAGIDMADGPAKLVALIEFFAKQQ